MRIENTSLLVLFKKKLQGSRETGVIIKSDKVRQC